MASSTTPPITSAGIGSGLDVTGLVNSLVNAESVPLNKLNQQKTSSQAKITAYGNVKNSLSQFQSTLKKLSDPAQLLSVKASSSDSSSVNVSAGNSAIPGSYQLQIRQLAQAQKLASAGQSSLTASLGTGIINFEMGSVTQGSRSGGHYSGASFQGNGQGIKSVTIDAAHSSLTGIADAINTANIGVTAAIINDGSNTPYRLTLTNSQTGISQSMKISVDSGTGSLSSLMSHDPAGTQSMTETVSAQNAKFSVDGVNISKPSNSITDVIAGLSFNLLQTTQIGGGSSGSSGGSSNGDDSSGDGSYSANSGSSSTPQYSAVTLSVSRDTQTLSANIKSFTDAYNTLNSTLKSLTSYNQATQTGAVLYGESPIRSILSQVRGIVTGALPDGSNALTRLYQAGIEFQKDGTLSLNQSKLNTAITNQLDDLKALFATRGDASDPLVDFVSSTTKTQTGNYSLSVSQLATQGSYSGSTTISSNQPISVDSTNNSLRVILDGVTATISVPAGNYTSASTLAGAIQSQINGLAAFSAAGSNVTYTVTDNNVSFSSARFGSASGLQISDPNGTNTLLSALFGNSPVQTNGQNVAGTINGVTANGFGQYLTAASGNSSEGLKIKVNGGSTGSRGNLLYTRGFAYQLDQLTGGILDNNGLIATRTNGINSSLKSLDDKITRMQDRLDNLKKQYTKQFNSLDQTMSSMTATQNYLTQQLSSLAKSSSSSN